MIAPQICEQIRELLLTDKYSLRAIARQMQVSPATVLRIARRRHWPPSAVREQRLTVAVRCPGCGGKIEVLPCRLCRARLIAARRRNEAPAAHD